MQKQDLAREQEIETPLSDTDEIEDSCTCLRTRISELGCETFWLQKIDYMRSSTVKQLLHCAVEFRGPQCTYMVVARLHGTVPPHRIPWCDNCAARV